MNNDVVESERALLGRIIQAFAARGWRDDGETALTLVRILAKRGSLSEGEIEAAISPQFAIRNQIARHDVARTVKDALGTSRLDTKARVSGALFEQTVRNLIVSLGLEITEPSYPFDFRVKTEPGRVIGVDVKIRVGPLGDVDRIVDRWAATAHDVRRIYLVSSQGPTQQQLSHFRAAVRRRGLAAEWVDGPGFASALGAGDALDLASPIVASALQSAAVAKRYENIGSVDPKSRRSDESHLESMSSAIVDSAEVSPSIRGLGRQFDVPTIQRLSRSSSLDAALRIGRSRRVTVVLSDLRDFSRIVRAADGDELQSAMNKYYRLARGAVWRHSGTLDKFIGDAVLAVFGYPFDDPKMGSHAVAFATDLIAIGRSVLDGLLDTMNEQIETGTRVGVATGQVLVLDIGQDEIEPSFVGNPINLAARLEKRADTDYVVLDHKTKQQIGSEDAFRLTTLNLRELVVPPSMAKGQSENVKAWTNAPLDLENEPGGTAS